MVDFAIDVYIELNPGAVVPDDFVGRRTQVVTELKELQANADKVLTILLKDEIQQQFNNSRDNKALLEVLSGHGVCTYHVCSCRLKY